MPPLELDPILVPYVAIAAVAVGGVALVLAILAHLRLRRLRRAYAVLRGAAPQEDLMSAVSTQIGEVQRLRATVESAFREFELTRSAVADALRHVAVVRYDAFENMGGRLSFSAALLDDAGDGIVLTAINGRSETRTYAKGLTGGRSDHPLSPEEERAVSAARRRATSLTLPKPSTPSPAH